MITDNDCTNAMVRIVGLQAKIAQRQEQSGLESAGSPFGRSVTFTASLEKELNDAANEYIGLKCAVRGARWDPLEIIRRMSLQRGQTV